MADIKQAAKWMEEGHSVRIASRPDIHVKSGSISRIVREDTLESLPLILRTPYLLADDWEIAE